MTLSLIWHGTFYFTKSQPYGRGWGNLISLVLICLQMSIFRCAELCAYPGVSWILPPAAPLCLSKRETESQNWGLFICLWSSGPQTVLNALWVVIYMSNARLMTVSLLKLKKQIHSIRVYISGTQSCSVSQRTSRSL